MSKRSDFYISKTELFSDLASLACRLAEKAYSNSNKVLIICENQEDANTIDDALWTFKDTAFLPHALTDAPSDSAPIAISTHNLLNTSSGSKSAVDILLYMQPRLLSKEPSHDRRLILVANDEHEVDAGRQLFKRLKQTGVEINHHDLRKSYI